MTDAAHQQTLDELGVDARAQARILATAVLTEFPPEASTQDPLAIFPDFLTDPELAASLQSLARALREFSQSSTGAGLYLPIMVR